MIKREIPIIYRSNTINAKNLNKNKNKKKLCTLLLVTLACLSMTACGKKGNSVSENLVNENPGEIQIDESLLMNNSTNDNSEVSADGTENIDSNYQLTPINGEDISVNPDSISENSASENEANNPESLSDNEATGSEDTESDITESQPVAMASSEYKEAADKPLTIGNISGLNINQLYITFNVGNMSNIEILGAETLNDGKSYEYTILDMSSIKSSNKVTLSITAQSGKKTIDFGSIDIYNPADMNVILATNKDGYFLYLE